MRWLADKLDTEEATATGDPTSSELEEVMAC